MFHDAIQGIMNLQMEPEVGVASHNSSWAKKSLFTFIPLMAVLLLGYSGFLVFRSHKIYEYLKSDQPGWRGKVFKSDPALGFAPVPCSRGIQVNNGFDTAVGFDDHGFRVPVGDPCPRNLSRPLVLSLGCSYTFGHGIKAEDTYTYLVAKRLNGTALNAGLPAYGFAQIQVLARELIPKYKPDYVLVQFSSWLTDRALWPVVISYPGKLSAPYFGQNRSGAIVLQPPLFMPKIFDLPISQYRSGKKSAADFLSFLANAGLPLLVHDDFQTALLDLRLNARQIPLPLSVPYRPIMAGMVYNEIYRLCAENDSQMVVVMIYDPKDSDFSMKVPVLKNVIVVDSWPALVGPLPDNSISSYYAAYAHVAGNPPIMKDNHPNQLANRIIAGEIIKALEYRGK